MKDIPGGVYPTMLTPFTSDNKVDYPAVEALLRWYAGRGVQGIFAICQSSEIFYLSFPEKLALLRFIMEHRPPGVAIVASGHTADDIGTQAEEARAYMATGIDGYVFISNRFAAQDEDDAVWLDRLARVADRLDPAVPLGLYECPYPYKRLLSLPVVEKLAAGGRFAFLKDTCCDIDTITARLAVMKPAGFKLFNANAATLLPSLRVGAAGYSGVMANFHPELYVWLCENYAGEPQRAEQMADFLGFASLAERQLYPVNAKYYLGLEGLPLSTRCRTADDSLFTANLAAEMAQMRRHTARFKADFCDA